MGWTFTRDQTEQGEVARIIRDYKLEPSVYVKGDDACPRGGAVYGVCREGEKPFILVALIDHSETAPGWGSKVMDESVGPNADSCPLNYLDLAPDNHGPYAEQWRKRVRARG